MPTIREPTRLDRYTTLSIYHVPGHVVDQIAILDERSRNLFCGDAIGAKFGESVFIPVFFAPF